MGSEDTCTYLKDVADHIYHLFIYNYQEMENHLLHHLNSTVYIYLYIFQFIKLLYRCP